MAEGKKPQVAVRAALIGLLGTMLTVCGGLAGAVISGAVTIYRADRENQRVALAAASSGDTLSIDTREIALSADEAYGLDADSFGVFRDDGFVIARPRRGWEGIEKMTYRDLFIERGGYRGSAWDTQPVYRIRYGQPVRLEYIAGTRENGQEIDLDALEATLGTMVFHRYNEITVLAVDKAVAPNYTLAGVAMEWGQIQINGVNRVVANDASAYVLMQVSWQMEDALVDGAEGNVSIERWALFAEGDNHYYVVEVDYIPRAGESLAVWDDLQFYMDSFRVIN
ncbi:MAG: hypothetical protein GX620_15280 [Chloroflexi bacterium]|nr:hypothetical protein [Chloroflexota bacterium]